MNTVINFYDEREQILSLSKHIDSLSSGTTESEGKLFETCNELLKKDDLRTALQKIIESSSIVFEKSNQKDIEAFFLLIISLISSKNYDLTDDLLKAITNMSNSKDDQAIRLSLLQQYFNYSQNSEIQTSIYISILDYANKTQQNEKALNFLGDNEKLIGELKPSLENQRIIYSLLYKLVSDLNPQHSKVFKTNFLQSFVNEQETSQWKDEIQSVVVSLINDPSIFQYETLIDTVGAKSLNQTPIFQLLDIFTYKRLSDFTEFINSKKAELESVGIDADAAETKMKLLTLLSLANENQRLAIADVAKELNISSEEVEEWVVNAISYGILDARIDELDNAIYVNYSVQREFTMNQWKNLHRRLTNWKDNVDRILEGLTQTEQAQ